MFSAKKLLLLFVFVSSTIFAVDPPFHKGIGFTGAFEASSAQDIMMNYYSRQDFLDVKSLGCDAVRFYISMNEMLVDGTLDPLYFYLLDQIVDIAEEIDMHLILANMSAFDYGDQLGTQNRLITIWTQMAEHYKNRSTKIHYEIANEPSGISDEDWGAIQGEVIDAIRAVDQTHTIIVTPANWANFRNLPGLPVYSDNNLVYTIHFYDPFIYTHQGAEFAGMGNLKWVPFPYDAARMPACPPEFIGTWSEQQYNAYSYEGTVEQINTWIDEAAAFKNERNVPLWCGEFGAIDTYAIDEERTLWFQTVVNRFEENGISWSIHEYKGNFSIFKKETNKLFDNDLNIPLLAAIGLNTPAQSEYTLQPDMEGFNIYDDYVAPSLYTWISSDQGTVTLYSQDNTKEGVFCIHMADFPLWCYIDFRFSPTKDLSYLAANDYMLEFWVKGDSPGASFGVKFIDTDEGDNDHPWRMAHAVDQSLAAWDGQWHLVQIPLSDFYEEGTYEDGWFDPIGAFDWGAISNFQIATDYSSFDGMNFWFDNVRIVDKNGNISGVDDELSITPNSFALYNNYPNPFNPASLIKYSLPEASNVRIEIFNMLGQKVADLVDTYMSAGIHEVTWNASGFSSGIYLIAMKAVGVESNKVFMQTQKAMLLK